MQITSHLTPRRAVIAATLAVLAGVVAFVVLRTPAEPAVDEPAAAETPDEAVEQIEWPLTGVLSNEVVERPALAVKISNSPEARPHTGLEHADVVIEELTEAGITRFMAVFHSDLPEVAGPVRSARPVDTQLAAGFDHPAFAYSGARDEVLEMLERMPAAAITEGGAGFFRDSGTFASHPVAPHNLFIRPEATLDASIDMGAQPLGGSDWLFEDEAPAGGTADGASLDIEMSDTFVTSWEYDADAGLYRRAQNGVPSELTGDGEIGAANVVVLAVRHYIGESGYPETDVLGDGDALVLRDGQLFPARWEKPTETDPIRILQPDGEPFPLQRGPTWIHLPDELPVS